jgi:hypothetical protein
VKRVQGTGGDGVRRGSARLDFGSPVVCTDGACGEILAVQLHSTTWRISHVIVRGRHEHGLERLVPVMLIASVGQQIEIDCTTDQFDRLDFFDEGAIARGLDNVPTYGTDQMSSLPLIDDKRVSIDPGNSDGSGAVAQGVGYANVPEGQLDVRIGARIDALDGHVGTLRGLVVELPEATVSFLFVAGGHLFGRREVPVPVAIIEAGTDALRVNASKRSLQALRSIASAGEHD